MEREATFKSDPLSPHLLPPDKVDRQIRVLQTALHGGGEFTGDQRQRLPGEDFDHWFGC